MSSFQKDFNDMVDDYRQAKKAGDAKAALLSKDKTRPLQFIPGIHVFEQGLLHLLSIAGVSADQWQNLSPEDMARKVAAVNPDVFCQNFRPSSVPASASQHSVDAAFSLSRWFQSVYHFSINAAQKLEDFRRDRLMKTDLPQPSAQAFAHTLQKAPGFFFPFFMHGSPKYHILSLNLEIPYILFHAHASARRPQPRSLTRVTPF